MTDYRTQNTENRTQNTEHRTQSTDRKQKTERTRCFVLFFLVWAAGSGLWVLSSATAVTWSPEDVLKTYLINNYPWTAIEISNVKTGGNIPAEAPERITVKKGPLGKAVFSLEFKNKKRITVNANVRALDWVVKSKRPFKNGHVLQKEDVYLSLMDITKMPRSAVKTPEVIIGKHLKRSVIADMPIVEGMTDEAPVKRGQRVTLLIESRGLSITAMGKTKEKGYVGMPIQAINLSSKKVVSGVLIDENTVKVGF